MELFSTKVRFMLGPLHLLRSSLFSYFIIVLKEAIQDFTQLSTRLDLNFFRRVCAETLDHSLNNVIIVKGIKVRIYILLDFFNLFKFPLRYGVIFYGLY